MIAATEFHRGEFAWLVCIVIGGAAALLFVWATFSTQRTEMDKDADRLADRKRGE